MTVQSTQKVLAQKGVGQVSKATSGEKGTLVTTCCIVSATGQYLPPVLIFPRVHFRDFMIYGAPFGTLGLANPSGWMNSELFVEVIKHFIKFSASSEEHPSLLIYDNHESHLSIEVLNLAKEYGITILTVPPHSTNKLQPLDVGVFKPFKTAYDNAVDSWMLSNPGKVFSIYNVAEAVSTAFNKAVIPANIISAFKRTGIYPFDDNVFTDVDYMPSEVTDCPLIESTAENDDVPIVGKRIYLLLVREYAFLNTNTFSGPENTSNPSFIPAEVFKGLPKVSNKKEKRRTRRRGKSLIATDTPEKNKIESTQLLKKKSNKRPNTENIKLKTVKKRLMQKESSEEDNNEEIELRDSSVEGSFTGSNFSDAFICLERNPTLGDYVVVQFQPLDMKKWKVLYIGKIVKEKDINNEYEVDFLRKNKDKFIEPIIQDLSAVPLKDIKMILPPPTLCGQTSRQNRAFKFAVDFSSMKMH